MDKTALQATLERQLRAAASPWDKLPILLELTKEQSRNDPDYGHKRALEALDLATQLNDQFWIACSLRAVGLRVSRGNNYAESLRYLRRAARLFGRIGNPLMQVQTELSIARVYMFTGKFDKAMALLMRNMSAFEEMENPYYSIRATRFCGEIYTAIGEHSKGYGFYRKALATAVKSGMELEAAFIHQDLAGVYRLLQDNRRQRREILRCLALHRKHQRMDGMANAMANIASMYIEQGKFGRAEKYVRWSGRLYRRLGFTANGAMAWGKQGVIHYHRGDSAQAFQCFRKGLALARRSDNLVILAKLYEHFGIFLLKEGRPSQAVSAMKKALRIIGNSGHAHQHHEIHWNLAEAYEQAGDTANALRHSKESMRLHDEYMGAQKILETGRAVMRGRIRDLTEQLNEERSRKHSLRKIIEEREAELAALTLRLMEHSENLHAINCDHSSPPSRHADNWDAFARQFHKIHHTFYADLIKRYPQLTPAEVKVCSLIRTGISSREIAVILNISKRTVDSHREHIRAKLNSTARLADTLADI